MRAWALILALAAVAQAQQYTLAGMLSLLSIIFPACTAAFPLLTRCILSLLRTVIGTGYMRGQLYPTDITNGECSNSSLLVNFTATTSTTCYGGCDERIRFAQEIRSRFPNTLLVDAGSSFWCVACFQCSTYYRGSFSL